MYPAKAKEIYSNASLFHVRTSEFFMSSYITFIKKTSACGSYVGHIQIAAWVSGSTSVTHFNLDPYTL